MIIARIIAENLSASKTNGNYKPKQMTPLIDPMIMHHSASWVDFLNAPAN